ncbi:hypothetical protein T440DRAFT_481759 [Plenodomus tracheiphilus IPT5]|uniref:FAD/NAD(P)-binding domain-containing protein n=1 Tax=Plenodomus tracheiphilus IPT5 TaxID=1408161 RepID=A0A6A7AZM5_9PLEO|nr:hypothetical protein T440DRAFT_481759 [Plenodomus tracheiphilus IPT5]
MGEFIKDKRSLEGFTSKFEVGCRRITPGDPYMNTIQKENGVIGNDGVERVDTIVCATGFDVTYCPRFPVIGKNSIDLYEKCKVDPEGYLGLAVPDMPNNMMFIGSTWSENGSVTSPLLSHTVWKKSCRSWYKDNNTGRVNAVWPGSSNHYAEVIETPRYEDFNIEYPNSDVSPSLAMENIDPKWLAAIGYERTAKKVEKAREEKEDVIVERNSTDGGEGGNSLTLGHESRYAIISGMNTMTLCLSNYCF